MHRSDAHSIKYSLNNLNIDQLNEQEYFIPTVRDCQHEADRVLTSQNLTFWLRYTCPWSKPIFHDFSSLDFSFLITLKESKSG